MFGKAVCLLSGGLDSCVTSFIAKDKGYDIYALTFRYSQRHDKEILCAKKISKSVDAKKHVILDIDFNKIGKSSLLDKSKENIQYNKPLDIGLEIPSTYVPARNTIFLSFALAYAESIDADAIFIGANAIDYSGYPDCRPNYIDAFQKMANLATKRGVEGRPIKIVAPLLKLNKTDIVKIGFNLNVPFEKTWSCYMGKQKACGRCDSCILRLKGFNGAGIKDPVKYE